MVSQAAPLPATPEEYRRRYMELKAGGQKAATRNFDASQSNPKTLPRDLILIEETIPAGWYWTHRIARGETLRLINDAATAGISALLWNAQDPSERYNAGDTVKVQWSARLSRGRMLLSDMGRVLASITDDTCGLHDFIAGCSSKQSDAQRFGADPERRNSRDNFILAASKHGLDARDIGPCVTFFAPVITDESGCLLWKASAIRAGDYIDLRAEMNLIVALSNCPHPLSPARTWQAEPVRAVLWRSPPPPQNDYCRSASEEAVRAFENTYALMRS